MIFMQPLASSKRLDGITLSCKWRNPAKRRYKSAQVSASRYDVRATAIGTK